MAFQQFRAASKKKAGSKPTGDSSLSAIFDAIAKTTTRSSPEDQRNPFSRHQKRRCRGVPLRHSPHILCEALSRNGGEYVRRCGGRLARRWTVRADAPCSCTNITAETSRTTVDPVPPSRKDTPAFTLLLLCALPFSSTSVRSNPRGTLVVRGGGAVRGGAGRESAALCGDADDEGAVARR